MEYQYYPYGALLKQVKMGNEILASSTLYSALAKPVVYRYGNGVVTENTFFSSNEKISTTSTLDPLGAEIQGFSYRFDDYGNVRFVENRSLQNKKRYAYDDLNRLVESKCGRRLTLAGQQERFVYDAIGNILKKMGWNTPMKKTVPTCWRIRATRFSNTTPNGNQTRGLDGKKIHLRCNGLAH
ncbi:MAG: hypothetical protein IPJ40_11995 [Saprospirales bacterium]|nr:hypothetical protein [Saprospirales bacterium]